MVRYLGSIEEAGVLPRGMGFMKKQEPVDKINLRSFYLRDTYAKAVSKGLAVSYKIKELVLRNVGLTDKNAL